MTEEGKATTGTTLSFLWDRGQSSPTKLGAGDARALSPDGRWVLIRSPVAFQVRAALVLLLHTGLRTSALFRARRSAGDLQAQTLTVLGKHAKATTRKKATTPDFACPLNSTAVAFAKALDQVLGPSGGDFARKPGGVAAHTHPLNSIAGGFSYVPDIRSARQSGYRSWVLDSINDIYNFIPEGKTSGGTVYKCEP